MAALCFITVENSEIPQKLVPDLIDVVLKLLSVEDDDMLQLQEGIIDFISLQLAKDSSIFHALVAEAGLQGKGEHDPAVRICLINSAILYTKRSGEEGKKPRIFVYSMEFLMNLDPRVQAAVMQVIVFEMEQAATIDPFKLEFVSILYYPEFFIERRTMRKDIVERCVRFLSSHIIEVRPHVGWKA